jgi:hypothetical protein
LVALDALGYNVVAPTATPEPGTIFLSISALGGIFLLKRRQAAKHARA